jgi:hypothetical protein
MRGLFFRGARRPSAAAGSFATPAVRGLPGWLLRKRRLGEPILEISFSGSSPLVFGEDVPIYPMFVILSIAMVCADMQIQQGRIWLSIPLTIPLPSAANSAAGGRWQSMANALSYRMYPVPEGRFSGG